MCFICDRIEMIKNNENPYFVKELSTGYVVLGDNPYFEVKNGLYFSYNSLPQTSIPLLREMSRSDKGFAVFARKRGTACGGRREKVFSFAYFVLCG